MKNKNYHSQNAAFIIFAWMIFLSFLDRPASIEKENTRDYSATIAQSPDSTLQTFLQIHPPTPNITQPSAADFRPITFSK